MDLLETILRSCDAEQYIGNFRDNGIDSYVLRILTDEDLQVVGIEDEAVRKTILSHCENLQIPTERKRDITVDNQYLNLVLSQISVHLNKHFANLSYGLKRKDTDLCYIELKSATQCLQGCLMSLEKEVENVESRILLQGSKKKRPSPLLLITTIGVTAIVLFSLTRYLKWSTHNNI